MLGNEMRYSGARIMALLFALTAIKTGMVLLSSVHNSDTNTVMKTRFIFGTQCAVAILAAGDGKLAAQFRYQYWYLSFVCNKTKSRSRLWCCSTIYASERGLGRGIKFRALYQKLLMGKIGVFTTVLVSKLWFSFFTSFVAVTHQAVEN